MSLTKTEIIKSDSKINVPSNLFESMVSVQEKDFQIKFYSNSVSQTTVSQQTSNNQTFGLND